MGAINRVPSGLLGLLNAKTLGRTPPDLSPVVDPVLDTYRHYLANIPVQKALNSQTGIVAPTYAADTVVPAGELWAVTAVNAQIVPDAVTTPTGPWAFAVSARTNTSNQTIVLKTLETPIDFLSATSIIQIADTYPGTWLFPPGTNFQVRVYYGDFTSVGTGLTATVGVNYHVLPV